MKKKHEYYVEEATLLAHKSTMIKRHGCVIVRNGEIVGKGYNYRTDKLKTTYSIHAEMSAIIGARKVVGKDLSDCTLYVVRISDKGLCKSLPCEMCSSFIRQHKISRCFFT